MSYLAGVVGADARRPAAQQLAPALPGAVAGASSAPEPAAPARSWPVVGAALLFIAGFTVIFLLGTVSAFGAISLLTLNADTLMRIGGVITIAMGLVFMGAIPVLQRDTRFAPRKINTWIGAPLLGGVFALGWTPCLGPTLAAIISVSAGTEGMTALRGATLIIAYCLGLGLPFVLVALGSARALSSVEWMRRHSRHIQLAGGIAMIIVGILLLSGVWHILLTLSVNGPWPTGPP